MTGVTFGEQYARGHGIDPELAAQGARFMDSLPQIDRVTGFREIAQWWAKECGWKIFPLYEAHRGPHPGKTPHSELLGNGWTADSVASNDWNVIDSWWQEKPYANMSLATRVNRVLVLDVDGRRGGWERLRKWCDEHSVDLSRVPRSTSPRGDGGAHLYWRVPDAWQGVDDPEGKRVAFVHSQLVQGVDRPWQVPLPPSMRFVTVDPTNRDPDRMNDYRPYRWEVGDPRELPDAPDVLLDPPRGSGSEGFGGSSVAGGAMATGVSTAAEAMSEWGITDAEGRSGWGAMVGASIPMGEQNSAFFRIACSMRNKNAPIDEAYRVVWETACASEQDPNDPWSWVQVCRQVNRAYQRIGKEKEERAARNREIALAIVGTRSRATTAARSTWKPKEINPEDL